MERKRIGILGAGESGVGAAILAKDKGMDVFVSDYGKIKASYLEQLNSELIDWEEKQHTEALILKADEVIKSPGIPDTAPIIVKIKEKQIPVISEIEFAGRYAQDSKMICITGSNGKTTTTTLLYHILKQAGLDASLAGNIGKSLAYQVAREPHAYYVTELSSFQLDNMYEFKAHIAILLNISPDHLDRYEHSYEKYADAKFRIIQNQTADDFFIYWEEDPTIREGIKRHSPQATCLPFAEKKQPGVVAYTEEQQLYVDINNTHFVMDIEELSLRGRHNLYNSMASAISSKLLDIQNEKIRASLSDFSGVPHRLEFVARVRGVDYINDSKATNVNSCWYALQSIHSKIVLILGGTDKGNDYSEIEALVKKKARALIFLGKDNSKLHQFFDGKIDQIEEAGSMEEAVAKAYQLAQKEDTVLLSPCCASFDLFTSYEDRGDQYKKQVRAL